VRLFSAIAAMALSLAAQAHAQEQEQDVTRTPIGDWTKVCIQNGATCVIEQVGKTASGEDALRIRIEKLASPQSVNGQNIEAVANIEVPLGVVLSTGLKLRIDQGDVSASPYFVCHTQGCLVRAPLQAELLASFKRGSRAQFAFTVIQEGEGRDVPVDISLSGFTRAFDSL
jgi:invasion protein IalB